MTFRIDDLLVAVLPDPGPNKPECANVSNCPRESIGTETQCGGNTSSPCTPCQRGEDVSAMKDPDPKKGRAWRDEQFASLSRELENALAR